MLRVTILGLASAVLCVSQASAQWGNQMYGYGYSRGGFGGYYTPSLPPPSGPRITIEGSLGALQFRPDGVSGRLNLDDNVRLHLGAGKYRGTEYGYGAIGDKSGGIYSVVTEKGAAYGIVDSQGRSAALVIPKDGSPTLKFFSVK